ncbi:MAG TPA: hypothetical protein VK154_13825 [Chitinophagales bacterium]|nr:hypothetical protein [Chitinophagales bacterium]
MKRLAGLVLLLITLGASAQLVEVSNPSKMPAKSGKFKVIGKNNDGIVVRLYGMEDVIHVYGQELKLETTKTIAFKNQDGPLQYIMLNKTGAVIFYLEQDKKRSLLYAQPVNSKFVEIGKPVLIDSIVDRKELVAANLRFKQSIDQSYLMVYYPYFSGGRIESIRFLGVSHTLNVLYNKTQPINRSERELEDSKTLIDNQGNTFLLLKPESEVAGAQYDVFRFDTHGELANYSITTERRLFNEPVFEIDNKNGNLVMTAFYDGGRGEAEPAAHGFLYASFDPANGTPVRTNYTQFSKEFIGELTGRENVTNQSLYTFNIRRSMLRNDGGALIVAESFIKDSREQVVPIGIQPGYNSYRTSEIFQFNDIIAFSITPDGRMEWSSVMRKKQASEDDNGTYSSFLLMNEKEKLRFIYLDDISASGVLNEYVLGSMGRYDRTTLLNQEEKDIMLMPKLGKQISPNEVVLPSYKGNALRLVKIAF